MPGETKAEKRTRQLAAIKAARGILKRPPGALPFADEMAAWKAEERAIEQRRENFLLSIGPGKPRALADLPARLRRMRQKARGS